MSETALFPGVYRGVVHDNRDPLGKGRIRIRVAQLLGSTPTTWAWPIAPTSNIQVAVPNVGEGVFVSFEGGDPSYPLWIGLFSGTLNPAMPDGATGSFITADSKTVTVVNGLITGIL